MKNEILDRIQQLGGDISRVKHLSFAEDWSSIQFNCPLYSKTWADNVFGIDEFYENNKTLYQKDPNLFYIDLINNFFTFGKEARGETFFQNHLFTPMKKGTPDNDEWGDSFEEESNFDEIRKIIPHKEVINFIQIFSSYGYPDHFYVSLEDPDQNNPTVFSTDHEVFFTEIDNEGSLDKFLDGFLTKEEFLEVVKDYIKNNKDKK